MDKPAPGVKVMKDLSQLLEFVEKLTEPDQGVDDAIYKALRPVSDTEAFLALYEIDPGAYWYWMSPYKYTASLDAAIALVERCLPGWSWEVRKSGLGYGQTSVWNPMKQPMPGNTIRSDHKSSPAIALLIALFRALQSQEPKP